MLVANVADIKGETFPAGRTTKVVVGPHGPLHAKHFVMGNVTIFPGGSVPLHHHEQEEVYTVLAGEGMMTIGAEQRPMTAGSSVYIPSGSEHSLANTGTENLIMMFVYAPAGVVDHWAQERNGKLK